MKKTNKIPIYQVIFDNLFADIKNGVYKVGEQIPTEKELMQLYNTSRITVARAVSELKYRNYINRLKGTGSFVTQKSMWDSNTDINVPKKKPTIAVVIPSSKAEISIELEVLQGIIKSCKKLGYAMTIYNNDDSDTIRDFEKNLISELVEEGIAGVIIFPSVENETPEIYNRMSRIALPYVILDRSVFGVEAPLVTSENRKGFYSVVEYVISRGHKRIAFVSGNTYESSCRVDRFYGYVKALTDYHLDIDDDLLEHHLFPENYHNQHYNNIINSTKNQEFVDSIKEMMNRFMSLEEPPTAIVVTNDYLLANIINIIGILGYSVPDDISIAGFDGLISNMLLSPVLTTVYQDFRAMGKSAISLLDKMITNPYKEMEIVRIPTSLFIGDSVKKL